MNIDDFWLELSKSTGNILCFSVHGKSEQYLYSKYKDKLLISVVEVYYQQKINEVKLRFLYQYGFIKSNVCDDELLNIIVEKINILKQTINNKHKEN